MIAKFPQSTSLLQEKGKLLYESGKYEFTKDIMNQVLKRDPYSIQARRILADIYGKEDQESERVTMLVIGTGDNHSPYEQYSFLEEHSILLRDIGQSDGALKTANFCIDLALGKSYTLSALSCSYQNLQTIFWFEQSSLWNEHIEITNSLLQKTSLKTNYIYEIRFFTKFLEAQLHIKDKKLEQAKIILQQLETVASNTNISQADVWLHWLSADIWKAQKNLQALQELQKKTDLESFDTPYISCIQTFVQHRIAKFVQDDARSSQALKTILNGKCHSDQDTYTPITTHSRIERAKMLVGKNTNAPEISELIEEVEKTWTKPNDSLPIVQEFHSIKNKYNSK
jgi:tetratricopeptide (TPR) repeat protein